MHSYVTRNPQLGSTTTHFTNSQALRSQKRQTQLPLQPPWWGEDRPWAGRKDQSRVSCHHPCISATNSSERRKYFTELVNLSHTKKNSLQCAKCHESCDPWTIKLMRLPLSMRRPSFFRPNWKGRTDELTGKHFHSKTINRWIQLIWTCTSTWLLSTENHLKRTPRWTTAGIILNSRGVVTCRGTHESVTHLYV